MTSPNGVEAGRGGGTGATVDWTWDSSGTPAGSYSWTISAGAARPATGILSAGGAAPPLAIDEVVAEPEAISPNGDGQADTTTLSYRISVAANVTVEITDTIGGPVSTVIDHVPTRAGRHTVLVDGAPLADGDYYVVVTARTSSGVATQQVVPLSVNRTLGLVSVTPAVFSPNDDGRQDQLTVSFSLAAPADVRIRIEREGRWVATPVIGSFPVGTQSYVWNGSRSTGQLRDAEYRAVVEATSTVGVISYGVPFVSDTVAPRVRVLPGHGLVVEVSEPAALALVVDGQSVRRKVRKAGIVRIPWRGPAARVRVVAQDAAGNVSGPVVRIRPGG